MTSPNSQKPHYIDAFCTPVNNTGVQIIPSSSTLKTVVFDTIGMLQRFYANNVFYGKTMPDEEKPVMRLNVPESMDILSKTSEGLNHIGQLPLVEISSGREQNIGDIVLNAVLYGPKMIGSRKVDHGVDYPSAGNHGYSQIPHESAGSETLFVWFNTVLPRYLLDATGKETKDEQLVRRSMERDRFVDYVRDNAFYCQK